MKAFAIAVILILIAVAYGWRFHPENIGTRRPVITREAKGNKVGQWKPAGFLDRFNGNREYQQEQAKIQADRDALVKENDGY